jgi:threonylcarbamoyladenosine tRNA methylthiotransferase MtaB
VRWVAVPAERPRIALRTLGCKVNRAESEALAEALAEAATVVMDSGEDADVVVVNTCTVTAEADAKARKAVRHALARGASAVVVTGCLAILDPEGLRAIDARVVVEADRSALPRRVAELAGADPDARTPRASGPAMPGRIRVMVKVQDGCDHRCTYCIVPDARGSSASVPTADVLARVDALARAGVPEVVLTGVNIGRYRDPAGAFDLASLLEGITATPIGRVRLSSIEPLHLDRRLLGRLAALPKVVPHLHVPLQSGCDRTLDAMGRGYTAVQYSAVLAEARAAVPGLSLTTDVIAGFPGESDADFAESLAFVEGAGFTRLHVFRYSRRAGTPAAARADQLPPAVKVARARGLRELSERLLGAHADARVGTEITACVERVSGGCARGTADDSLAVDMAAARRRPGETVRVRIDGTDGRSYRATVLESPVTISLP